MTASADAQLKAALDASVLVSNVSADQYIYIYYTYIRAIPSYLIEVNSLLSYPCKVLRYYF